MYMYLQYHTHSSVSSCMYVSEIMIDLHAELSHMYYNQPEEIDQVHSGVEYVDSDSDVEDIPKQTTRKGIHTQLFICISYVLCLNIKPWLRS